MVNLGALYDDKCSPPDPKRAVELFERASSLGNASAAWNLAMHYKDRDNRKEYCRWLQRAADLGDEDAISALKESR